MAVGTIGCLSPPRVAYRVRSAYRVACHISSVKRISTFRYVISNYSIFLVATKIDMFWETQNSICYAAVRHNKNFLFFSERIDFKNVRTFQMEYH